MFGTALSVFMGFQFKPQQHFHANSTLTFASYLLQNQLENLHFIVRSSWEILSLLLLPQYEVKLAVSPKTRSRCHFPEYLRAPFSEGCLFLCMTLSLFKSFRVREIIFLHDKYLHFSWKRNFIFIFFEQIRSTWIWCLIYCRISYIPYSHLQRGLR